MTKSKRLTLEVHQAYDGDIYQDRVRIPLKVRTDEIAEGDIYLLGCGDAACFVEIRGDGDSAAPIIRMDDKTRNKFELEFRDKRLFTLRKATKSEELRWGLDASNPVIRVQSRVALRAMCVGWWSLALGLLSLLLALLSLAVAHKEVETFADHVWAKWGPHDHRSGELDRSGFPHRVSPPVSGVVAKRKQG